MVKRPVQDAIEAYVTARYGITEPSVTFDWGTEWGYGEDGAIGYDCFEVTVTGETDGGESFLDWHKNDDAVRFLDAAMSWEQR